MSNYLEDISKISSQNEKQYNEKLIQHELFKGMDNVFPAFKEKYKHLEREINLLEERKKVLNTLALLPNYLNDEDISIEDEEFLKYVIDFSIEWHNLPICEFIKDLSSDKTKYFKMLKSDNIFDIDKIASNTFKMFVKKGFDYPYYLVRDIIFFMYEFSLDDESVMENIVNLDFLFEDIFLLKEEHDLNNGKKRVKIED